MKNIHTHTRRALQFLMVLFCFILGDLKEAGAQVDTLCYARYSAEIESSKQLISGRNGSLTDFLYAQRRIRNKYFEPEVGIMMFHQRLIDVWEAYGRGIVEFDRAMALTVRIQAEGYQPSGPAKMKPC